MTDRDAQSANLAGGDATIRDVADRFNQSTLPGSPPPGVWDLYRLSAFAPPRGDGEGAGYGGDVLSAVLGARVRMDDPSGCLALLRVHWRNYRLVNATGLTRRSTFFLDANAAEALNSLGDFGGGALHARRAVGLSQSPAERFRAESILALCLASKGDFSAAETHISRCEVIARENSADWSGDSLLLNLARAIVGTARGDADGLHRVADNLRRGGDRSDLVQYLAEATSARAFILDGRYDEAMYLAGELFASGATRGNSLARVYLHTIYLDALLSRGEPRQVLSILDARPPSPVHAVCLNVHRGIAHAQLGEDRAVLRVTQECTSRLSEHSPLGLVPLLIVRGLAQFRLGELARSRRSLTDGLRLADGRGVSIRPFAALMGRDIDAALAGIRGFDPEVDDLLSRAREHSSMIPRDHVLPSVPRLTSRETRLAWEIYERRSNAAIAEKYGVSVHTVKAQLSTLYRKLGVRDRESAVSFLQARDFYTFSSGEHRPGV